MYSQVLNPGILSPESALNQRDLEFSREIAMKNVTQEVIGFVESYTFWREYQRHFQKGEIR